MIKRLEIKSYNNILLEKLLNTSQSSCRTDKYEYLPSEETQGNILEKQTKTIKDHEEKKQRLLRPDGPYSISDIPDYFEHNAKKIQSTD